MDFVTPILLFNAFLYLTFFSIVVIYVGFATRHYKALSSMFFSNLEIVSGAITLITNFACAENAGDLTSREGFWVQFSAVMTIGIMMLAVGHLLEIKKVVAPPLSIVLLGAINLRILQYIWYLATEYEVHW